MEELEYAEETMKKIGVFTIDTTTRAVKKPRASSCKKFIKGSRRWREICISFS
jgi:regulator of PEP synthase PpsR (kinase-PPPase family)